MSLLSEERARSIRRYQLPRKEQVLIQLLASRERFGGFPGLYALSSCQAPPHSEYPRRLRVAAGRRNSEVIRLPRVTDAIDCSSRERLRIEDPFCHLSAVNFLVEILPGRSQRSEEPAWIVGARDAAARMNGVMLGVG